MLDQTHVQAKSRLGRMLVEKGMISPEQLDKALSEQVTSGRKLGEILMDQGLISSRQLKRALRRQTSYRTAAAFAAIVMGPIAPLASFAAPIGVPQAVETSINALAKPLVIEPVKTHVQSINYGSYQNILMGEKRVALLLPEQQSVQYDNLCLRAPEAMCS